MSDTLPNPRATTPSTPRIYRPGDVLCPLDDLSDPGSKGPFLVTLEDEETEIFLTRKDGEVRAYLNVCPHRYMPLNWKDDAFLTFDKTKILCVVHAALFNIEDGSCATMHAFEGLTPVTVAVEDDNVRLVGTVGRPV